MKYGSVCSGVEAATVAWHGLGWEPQWFSEIEKFPSAVLAHHYPDVPNYGDMTAFKGWPDDRSNGVELIVGGPPCQDFSIAGQRRGMSVAGNEGGERANLTLKYLDLVAHFRPRWICYENVPGLLSSNRGRDFGAFLGALAELGYGFAWRTLDAQFYGVPQRRRRVFVVGYLGDWRRAAAVLFERESLSGHPAPSRKARQETASCITSRVGSAYDAQSEQFIVPQATGETKLSDVTMSITASYGQGGVDLASKPLVFDTARGQLSDNHLQPTWPAEIASTLNAAFGDKQGLEDQHINSGAPLFVPDNVGPLTAGMHKGPRGTEAVESNHVIAFGAQNSAAQGDSVSTDVTPTLDGSKTPAVAFAQNQVGEVREGDVANTLNTNFNASGRNTPLVRLPAVAWDEELNAREELAGTLLRGGAGGRHDGVMQASAVRRLTPKECERLQGFSDNYTQIAWRNKPAENCPDGPRYKAMGNSMAVPVMRWLGERISMVDAL